MHVSKTFKNEKCDKNFIKLAACYVGAEYDLIRARTKDGCIVPKYQGRLNVTLPFMKVK